MPDKRSVIVGFHSRQQDGASERLEMPGELYRLETGWVLTYLEPADENGKETNNTLFIHGNELRLRRRGTIYFEQLFRKGESLPGKMETPYGTHEVEAITSRLESELSESGGVLEWKYELTMHGVTAGVFHIRLDIREEQ
ncbi:DUF1934 domain-containing protein [Cohnella endophytica]|uniref:DUF1934 domain-containing protein n=1 Tax=Cohnella endophytica TaxID=2419778 RepID=A0A494XEG9_9BACL|nr:DUF1934 domain-containing protein [Cohnella endophytica]RKP48051.1 DUF1934 domain-containing protein [Cohnella endophytica]